MTVSSPIRTDKFFVSRYLVRYPAGAKIYTEGEIGTELYTVHSGEVEITKTITGETRVMARLRKGDFFGELSVLDDLPRESTARARTDVELIRINGSTLEAMLKNSPEIAVRMMRRLSRQVREATAVLEEALGRWLAGNADAGSARNRPGSALEARRGPCQLISTDRASRFFLNREGDTVVGRADPVTGATPDVDLTPLDPQRSVTRHHARLYRIGEIHYLMEEVGVVNGTFINEIRLATGTPAAVCHGDLLRLGSVALTFWNPPA